MPQTPTKNYVQIPKQEYDLLKEVYRTVKRQAFLVRLDGAEKNLTSGKTKTISAVDLVVSPKNGRLTRKSDNGKLNNRG